jgi:predicted nucleotidyltransferase
MLTMDPILNRFVSRVRERLGDRLIRVSLFRSRARRTHKPYSDYDLLVVVRGDRRSAREEVAWVDIDMLLDCGANLSTKVLTDEEFGRLRRSATAFWRSFERDELPLWPT